MKNLIISIVALLLVTLLQAQDFERSNTVSIVSTPSSWDESFNLGVQYSYYNETIYVSPEIFIAPELDNIPYTHFALRFGLNQHFGKFERWGRVFTGIRIGVIRRDGYGHALLGLESGIDIFIPKTPFLEEWV